jgi:hypothetical protein
MNSLRSPDIYKNTADIKSKKYHLTQRSDMNSELRFLPIPENSRANQLIRDFRKLNQFMKYNMAVGKKAPARDRLKVQPKHLFKRLVSIY